MKLLLVVLTALAAAVAVSAGVSSAAPPSNARPATVGVATTPLGRILVDGAGHTLYLFEKDKRGRSLCSGACVDYWPPLLTTRKPAARPGAKASLLGITRRSDGRTQVTYAGHPVYRFVQDTKPGQTNGQNLRLSGAEWYVLSPAGRKIEKENVG
jgi:predicted lipoprotein with Yx(FWY)xxD motif